VKYTFTTKEKYDIVYFKYFTKYVYLSRIHNITNSGTWLYFYISVYVARLFTNGNFGIRSTGASEMVHTSVVSKCSVDGPIHFKFPITPIVGGVRGGPQVCKVLLGGPRTRNI
jgi:hypothetical protein